MTPKEKAQEIYNIFENYTHGYVGSSMLTNDEFKDIKIDRTKEASIKCVEQMIIQNGKYYLNKSTPLLTEIYKKENAFLFEVKHEITKL